MTMRAILALPLALPALCPQTAIAQIDLAPPRDRELLLTADDCDAAAASGQPGPVEPCASGSDDIRADGQNPAEPRKRLFPLGGTKAIERGYRIPEPWGVGAMFVWNDTNFNSQDLSVTVSKGEAPPEDANLIPLPSVTTRRIEADSHMTGFKADLWLLPPVNLFVAIGKVKGTNRIDVDIDLDEIVPFPFCRPSNPCGTIMLPVEAEIDNTTITLGTILVYGSENWFISGSAAKTLSISSKERSDVESTNLAFRGGPRFQVGEDSYVAPYMGANFFDLATTVRGVVGSGPLFEDGDPINLRYEVELRASHPWAMLTGMNAEISRHFSIQAELQAGARSTRVVTTTSVRF